MPTYEYNCKKCHVNFEKFQRMSDEPLKTCPTCGGRVHRVIGKGLAVIFKGSGFHSTDYKGGNGSSSGSSCSSCATGGCSTCSTHGHDHGHDH
ncbi:MAG: zinc ribbon domain-containing protein [Candidatus Brocadiia bacterium]